MISDNAQTKGQGLAMVSFETLKNAEKATFKKNSFVYSQRFIQIFFLWSISDIFKYGTAYSPVQSRETLN